MKTKIQITFYLLAALFFFSANPIAASEGRMVLKSGNVSCEGVSVWDRSNYQINGKCFGLVYPHDEQLDTYVLWVRLEDGEIERVTEIDRGVFDGSVNDKFTGFYVTVETDSNPRQLGKIILSGNISFFSNSTDTKLITPTQTPSAEGPVLATSQPRSISPLDIAKTLTRTALIGILVIGGIMLLVFLVMRKK